MALPSAGVRSLSLVALLLLASALFVAGPASAGKLPDFAGTLFTPKMGPALGRRPVLVILWDPHRATDPAPSKALMERMLFGPRPSMADWFRENSCGRFTIERAGLMGWYDADKPADHYWNTSQATDPNDSDGDGWLNGHVEKWAEAIRKADRELDYAVYDKNNDGALSTEELGILVVIPQRGPFGTVRNVVGREAPKVEPLVVDGVKVDTVSEWYTGTPPNFGAPAHELSHLLLGAPDMYFGERVPYAARAYSLMDASYTSSHLDPFEKLKLGWLSYRVAERGGEYVLRDIQTRGDALILYDPKRGPGEYFLIENRWAGSSYEAGVRMLAGGIPANGIAIWDIVEDPALLKGAKLPKGVAPEDWGRASIRMVRSNGGDPLDDRLALFAAPGAEVADDTTPASLRWADGSPSGFRVRVLTNAGPTMRLRVDVARQGHERRHSVPR